MKKNISFTLFLLFLNFTIIFAQPLPLSGMIEFEKRVNKFAFIEKELKVFNSNAMKEDFLSYKNSNPQFLILKSQLSFSESKTVFTPIMDQNDLQDNTWNGKPIDKQINIVYNDFLKNETIVQKEAVGESYLITDSIRSIKWKITDQTREILGYNCRRANGVLMDSIYVVAFYTGEIPVQSGPESFVGLPGMILGVALPYENVSWFATKVELLPGQMIKPPLKGKSITYKLLLNSLDLFYKSFKNGRDKIKGIML